MLVIHGMDDEYGSSEHPRQIAGMTSGAVRLELMDDTKHVPHREEEADVVRMVSDFVAPLP